MEEKEEDEQNLMQQQDKLIYRKHAIIKNLIISGGGPAGLAFYGSLKTMNQLGMWKLDNIQHIYGTSIGAILAFTLALNYDWNEIDDFIIKRPWHKIFKVDLPTIINAIENKGMYNRTILNDILKPLLFGKDLSLDITLQEFYQKTKVHCHFITMKLKSIESLDISDITHPNWKLLDAIYCSIALPICFSPFYYENDYLCDGGFISNYPVEFCMQDGHCAGETIGVGFEFVLEKNKDANIVLKEENKSEEEYHSYNLFDYMIELLFNLIRNSNNKRNKISLYKEILLNPKNPKFHDMYNIIHSQESRSELIKYGEQIANKLCI